LNVLLQTSGQTYLPPGCEAYWIADKGSLLTVTDVMTTFTMNLVNRHSFS